MNGARVRGAPIAGWFFPGDAADEPGKPWLSVSAWPQWSQGETGGGSAGEGGNITLLWNNSDIVQVKACAAAEGAAGRPAWLCGSVHNMYRFIQTPLFVMENQYDTNQLHAQLLLPNEKVYTAQELDCPLLFRRRRLCFVADHHS